MKQLQFLFLLLVANGSSSFLSRNFRAQPSRRHSFDHDTRRLQSPTVETAAEGNSLHQTLQQSPIRNQTHSLYLFSLPAPSEAASSHGSVLTKRLWEFKDETLGDGRDFFVPRPKTIAALNQILCEQVNSTEAVVLSNCARFDVILVTENSNVEELRKLLALALLQQYEHSKEQKQKRKLDLSFWLDGDQPNRLLLGKNSNISVDDFDWKTLSHNLQCLEGPGTIALYMCRVASGLQAQGRRPDRDVVFRPFSSRDAHVMLQLKRTADIASTTSSPRIKALLDTALQSGKAARDPDIVPAILPLKKYGSGGSSGRYSLGDAPADLIREAASVSLI
jgi:hypothetical protein